MLDKGMELIPFPIQIRGYRSIMNVLKVVAKNMPFPRPTLFSGPGASIEMCETIARMGTKKVLIVTDAMLVKIGLINGVKETFDRFGVEYVIYDGVLPDPTSEHVMAGLGLFKRNNCEAVLAFGGGSSMDAAKIISAMATNNKPIMKLAGFFKVWKACAPLYCIPTTAGTGSEVSVGAVISDPKTHKKNVFIDPKLVPLMASLDGSLMTGLPPHITAATGMDALTHAVEAFISRNAFYETDKNAIAAVRLIMENLPTAFHDGGNLEARQKMVLASYLAGLAFTKANLGYVHAISHNFGAFYHTPHGMGNAMVLPHVLDFSKDAVADRLAELAEVSGLKSGNESKQQLAQKFIDRIRDMLKEFNIPEKLDKLKASDIPTIAKNALKEAHFTYSVPKYMDQDQCEQLVKKMLP